MNQKRKVTGRCTRNPPPKSVYETVLARRAWLIDNTTWFN
jgi:hypothetical protein